MKGIVVESNHKNSIILTDDGLFSKVKNRGYEAGQTIDIKMNQKKISKMIIGVASLAAVLVICTIGSFAYYTPTDYVSLDVNPSVEYTVNRFDRILDVTAVNDDGEEILSSLNLNHMMIEDAVKGTLAKLIEDGYLTDDLDGGVVITTSNDEMGEAEELAAELEQEIQTYLDSQDAIAAKVEAEAVGSARVREARKLGVTPGKLNLVEKLQESTSGAISVEEWLTMPVKDINKAIKENRESAKEKREERLEEKEQSRQNHNQDEEKLKVEDTAVFENESSVDQNNRKDNKDNKPAIHQNNKTGTDQAQQREDEKITNRNKHKEGDQLDSQELERKKIKNENQLKDKSKEEDDKNQSSDANQNSKNNKSSNSNNKSDD